MWIFDVETLEFLAVNDAAVRHYGYSRDEFLDMTIMDVRPAEDRPLAGSATRPAVRETAFTRHQRKDGTLMDMELVSHELELDGRRARLVLATDISDRTRTRAALHHSEEQLRQAQRLDAVGRLAGGVAHDFNNLLTTIRGFGDILLRELDEDDPRRADAAQIRKAADRGVLLTGQLLAFGQRQLPQPQVLDLNQVIHSMEGLIRRLLGADIRLDLRLLPGSAMVRMDPGHLDQLLINIILNAREAMPGGGTLTIETGERQIAEASRHRRVRPGTYVMLAIHDTGGGMDAETAERFLEPFQTTDPREQRAGLGLSIVYGIVRQNGGVVRVSSEPGQGSSVKVYLPHGAGGRAGGRAAGRPPRRGDRAGGGGRRRRTRAAAPDPGPSTATRCSRPGMAATRMVAAERYERPIDLLVTDVVMPEMGGGELAEKLMARRPDLKVLYISGYTNDEVVRRGIQGARPASSTSRSPSDDFMRRVREVLDARASAATGPGPGSCEGCRGPPRRAGATRSRPGSSGARPGRRRRLAWPEPLLIQQDQPALGILVHHPHHRPGRIRAGRRPSLRQPHEHRAHPLDHVHRPAQLLAPPRRDRYGDRRRRAAPECGERGPPRQPAAPWRPVSWRCPARRSLRRRAPPGARGPARGAPGRPPPARPRHSADPVWVATSESASFARSVSLAAAASGACGSEAGLLIEPIRRGLRALLGDLGRSRLRPGCHPPGNRRRRLRLGRRRGLGGDLERLAAAVGGRGRSLLLAQYRRRVTRPCRDQLSLECVVRGPPHLARHVAGPDGDQDQGGPAHPADEAASLVAGALRHQERRRLVHLA